MSAHGSLGKMLAIDRDSFVPLYVQLKNLLQRQILSGQLSAGSVVPSEFELCRLHGVSRMTVRQALGDLESEGLIRREPGRGTFVLAEMPRRGLVLGLLFGGFGDHTFGRRSDAFGDLFRGVAEVTGPRGALIHAIHLSDDDRLDVTLSSVAVRSLVNGLLVRIAREMTEESLDALDRTGLPYVVVKRRVPPGRASCVVCDDVTGAAAGTEHLLGLGHRRIGLLLGPREIGTWADRRQGYELAHARHDLAVDPDLIYTGGLPLDEAGYRGTLALLARRQPPTALFAASDHIAAGAYRAIRELGLEPGADVAVLGYGGASFAGSMQPPLTTVTVPICELGRQATSLLFDLITGAVNEPQTVVVPWRLDLRDSTPALPVASLLDESRA